ncbi:CAF17-like 4Fe-4S cluster assembly/insertion protein YgfZ [Stakelama tenebrarum]|uniref:Folate-binding protein n=1 Tax=Stakelama tenebrarum TaxID=2711215 RepID=A0A6G6YAF4_9SPHN|nr:folate-binding protein [Sphingosinithalassobacter tenebrarum]QIG81556.1 folate-binding protein [Sphingosinithalassobacter tenebrarum]
MSDTSPATLLADRALLRVSGEDVRGFLQGLVTQDMTLVTPETPQWAGLLSPQGKALFDFLIWEASDGTMLIDCESEQLDALARRLTLYRLRRPIEITPVDDIGVHWAANGTDGYADPRLARLGRRWLGTRDAAPATGWRAHRLGLGVTEGVAELGQDKTLWLECNARELNGVRFDKGCFIGQENTARMHYRGKVNRRLVVAPLGEESNRTRARYPELGLMVEHRRIDDLGNAHIPDWLAAALAVPQE